VRASLASTSLRRPFAGALDDFARSEGEAARGARSLETATKGAGSGLDGLDKKARAASAALGGVDDQGSAGGRHPVEAARMSRCRAQASGLREEYAVLPRRLCAMSFVPSMPTCPWPAQLAALEAGERVLVAAWEVGDGRDFSTYVLDVDGRLEPADRAGPTRVCHDDVP